MRTPAFDLARIAFRAMTHDEFPLHIDITDMIGRPGSTQDVDLTVPREEIGTPAGEWGPADEALTSPVVLTLVLEMLVDGLVARGRVAFRTAMPCARCLAEVRAEHAVDVSEVYLDPRRTEDDDEVELGYELRIMEGLVSLEALVRDAIIGVLPVRVLCREDCAGLCPACGIDRNTETCEHGDAGRIDPRWAALEKLDLPPG
jgi:uncharacterized protein